MAGSNRRTPRALLVTALLAGSPLPAGGTAAAQQPDLAALETRIDSLRQEWGVPGLALAIVRNDTVLLARGFGYRDTGGRHPVNAETLFAIGSTTKAFTSAAVGALVGDGVLHWDDRVVDRLPGFALADPWLTDRLTIRDALAHRSGLPMANLMWVTGQLDSEELIRRLRYLEVGGGFRTNLAYQNVMYLVAASIVARQSGLSWSDFLGERFFGPLGMRRTRTSTRGLDRVGNVAAPHVPVQGTAPRPVGYRDIDAVGPAGSILSTAADMAQWLRFQLGGGEVAGRRLVVREALHETHRAQMLMPLEGALTVLYPDATMVAYGMGWVVSQHRGLTMLDHSGGIDGMTSLVAMLPERNIGVAILTNLQAPLPPYWLLNPILDHLLGHEPGDRYVPLSTLAAQAAGMAWGPARVQDAPRPSSLVAYAGAYENDAIGSARVAQRDGELIIETGSLTATLEPWHFETFRARWNHSGWSAGSGPGWVTFRRDAAGRVQSLELMASPGETWTFERNSS